MCSANEVREIVDTALNHYSKENKVTHWAKSFVGMLVLAVTSAIGFNTTMLYAMKDVVNDSGAASRYEMLAVVAKNRADILLLLQKNVNTINELVTWQRLHKVSKDAIINKYDMLIDNNKQGIDRINNSGVDNRWRKRDEEADNRNKDLIHEVFEKEDRHLHEKIDDNNRAVHARVGRMEEDFTEFKTEYFEFHDRIILHLRGTATHVE